MSEIIAEKPSTYKTTINTNAAHRALYNNDRRGYFDCCGWTSSRNSYDVTDNKTNEFFIHQWKCEQFTMDEKYQREDERLKSFENWPLEWLNKKELAQTGLVYTGEDDKVKCYFCEVEIGRWERDDQPINEHLRFSPNCPLLRRRTTNNVPISNDTLTCVLPPVSYDVCGNEGHEFGANDVLADIAEPQAALAATTTTYQYDSIAADNLPNNVNSNNISSSSNSRCGNETQLYRPEYPEYAIEAARLRSFAEWPRNMKQRPKELADAGFFYTGTGDRVKCFSCGCGLKDWDDDDEPWEQHALWMPKCRYLNLLKGHNYIENIAAKYKTNNSKCADTVSAESDLYRPTSDTVVVQPVVAAATLSPSCKPKEATNDVMKSTAAATIAEEKLCKICYADEYNTAFLPCGHVVACAKCASSVSKCPVCRKPFTNVMRVFFP
uniref:Apoptosis 1 inhibitor n=1 Tax=Zeugodacus cucurbitae TaxID=28588 RepID=A0A0A1XBF2_ZEUCU